MKKYALILVIALALSAIIGIAATLNPAPHLAGLGNNARSNTADLSTWNKCSNEEMGYSVLFPAGWHTYGKGSYSETSLFQDSDCAGSLVFISPRIAEDFARQKGDPEFAIQYQTEANLGVDRYKGLASLEDYLARNPDLTDDINQYEPIVLDDKRFIWIQKSPLAPKVIGFENGSLITISGSASSSEAIFISMLSTVRFARE